MIIKHRIKRVLSIIIIGTLLSQISYTQENYLSGSIIDINNDTIHGYIDYRNWKNNPVVISFKPDFNKPESQYTPLDIIGFRVLDESYVSAIINTETSSDKVNNLRESPNLHIKIDTTFLQTLWEGKKSVYYYANSLGTENFYIKQNANFELLIYKKYLKKHENTTLVTENKKYIGQLTLYLNDCPNIQPKINATSYSLKSIYKLFQEYYNCVGHVNDFKKERPKVILEIGVQTGLSISNLNFSGTAFEYLVKTNFNSSSNLTAGLFFDFVLPRNQGKWSVNNELLYTSYKITGTYEDFSHDDKYTIITSEFEYSFLKLNNMFRFKYPVGDLFLFLNAGISTGFVINENSSREIRQKFYSQEQVEYRSIFEDKTKYEPGYNVGFGSKYKDFSFECRYERGNGGMTVQYVNLSSYTEKYYFLLGYRF